MPTVTFFRLPEEKRARLIEAAMEEFTRVSFADASINRIVQGAHIPRGSFYQYFSDKEDLFLHLMERLRDSYVNTMRSALEQVGGDLFAMPLRMFDLLIDEAGAPVPALLPCVQILKLNQSMDVLGILGGKPDQIPPELLKRIDRSTLRRQEEPFVSSVFELLVFSLVTAMLDTLWGCGSRETQRSRLCDRVAIIRDGSINSAGAGEETR